jgi:hypothetical protein
MTDETQAKRKINSQGGLKAELEETNTLFRKPYNATALKRG